MRLLTSSRKLETDLSLLFWPLAGEDLFGKSRLKLSEKDWKTYFHFLPFQENPARAMKGVDVIVMPSLSEAYGLLAAEAMVAGVPIIGTDCIGLREVLRDTPARVVPAADSKALAEAIIAEIENSSIEKMKHFRDEASKRFDVTKSTGELQNLIIKLVD